MSDKKSIRTKILAVIPVVTGIICAAAFLWNAFFDLCYEYRRSLIGCLLLAAVYIALGIVIRKCCLKAKDRLPAQIVSVIFSFLFIPSTILASFAMCAITFRPVVYGNYKAFSGWGKVYIDQEDLPDNAVDCKFLKKKDGHVNAVSFRLDAEESEKYEKAEYEWSFVNDPDRGRSIDEFSKQNSYFDFKNTIIPIIGDDDINDYVVLDSSFGNEWTHERFVNRKTGRYILVVTRDI